jgi:hypothetical protein
MALHADLYLDQVDLDRYVGTETCRVCHVDSFELLIDRLRSEQQSGGLCPHWPPERVEAFRVAVNAGKILPTIPSLEIPRPTEAGLLDLNDPTPNSPMLITGNSRLTHDVLLAVLSTTTAPMWLMSIDTAGHTVDMSLVYGTLTADAVADAFDPIDQRADGFTGRILLPGLAKSLAVPVSRRLHRPVEIGPICAAELPLFFGSNWTG